MIKQARRNIRKINHWLIPKANREVRQAIDLENVRVIRGISAAIFVIELITIIIYMLTSGRQGNYKDALTSVSFCEIVCIIVIVGATHLMNRYKKDARISHAAVSAMLIVSYVSMSIWWMLADFRHYQADEQMLTFYIVQFCYAIFTVFPVRVGAIAVVMMYLGFFGGIVRFGTPGKMQWENFFVFCVLNIIGLLVRYKNAVNEHSKRFEIQKFNEILQEDV